MDRELFEKLLNVAEGRYAHYQKSGPRGQLVTERDGIEYWLAEVAYEWGRDQYAG